MDRAAPTRRALLGSALLAPIAAASCLAPATASVATDRAAWDQAFAEMQRLLVAQDDAERPYNAAYDRWQAAIQPKPLAGIEREFPGQHAEYLLLNLDLDAHVARLMAYPDSTQRVGSLRLAEAIRSWRRVNEREQIANNVSALARAVDAAVNAYLDAACKLVLMPAPDLDAVSWKLSFLFDGDEDESSSWRVDFVRAVVADVRRLAGEGR